MIRSGSLLRKINFPYGADGGMKYEVKRQKAKAEDERLPLTSYFILHTFYFLCLAFGDEPEFLRDFCGSCSGWEIVSPAHERGGLRVVNGVERVR